MCFFIIKIEDFEDMIDNLVRLYILVKPEELNLSYSELRYYNSPIYRSHLYRFIKNLNYTKRDILNTAIITGYWLYSAP